MKTEDSLGPVQLKDDEDDENKNSHNKEALEASNLTTIQDISNFWSEWDLNPVIQDFQVPGSHHSAHCIYGHSS